jgi:hypothetical protein
MLAPEDPVRVPAKCKDVYVPVLMDLADAQAIAEAGTSLSIGSHGYAQMWWNKRVTLVHRWILGLEVGNKLIGDHINGDPMDNRRANLRAVTASGSSQNVAGRGKSKHRGVVWYRDAWAVAVKFHGKVHHRYGFENEAEAAVAADAMRRDLMPDYAGPRIASAAHGRDLRKWNERMARQAELREIRAWATANDIEVSEVGRIPKSVLAAYEARTQDQPAADVGGAA